MCTIEIDLYVQCTSIGERKSEQERLLMDLWQEIKATLSADGHSEVVRHLERGCLIGIGKLDGIYSGVR